MLFKDMGRVITALEAQKRNTGRVNVHLDGVYAFSLARIVAAWLSVGRELSNAEIEKLQQDDSLEAAAQAALRYIAYKPRTSSEVRSRLAEMKLPEAVIEHTISRFTQTGIINDGQYARDWVETRQVVHPRSTRMMDYELRRKGIDRQEIEAALVDANDDDQLAYQLARQKIGRFESLDFQKFKTRLGGLLTRHGFSYEVVTRIVNRLWSERKTETTQS